MMIVRVQEKSCQIYKFLSLLSINLKKKKKMNKKMVKTL